MSFSDRRRFIAGLAGLVALAGCRFTPAHAPGGAGQALAGMVRADDPVSRADFHFVAALEERLGRAATPRFALSYDLTIRPVRIGTARMQLQGRLDYVLSNAATGDERTAGHVEAMTGYSRTTNQMAEVVAAEDAELRLARMLAEALVTRLLILPDLAAG